MADIVGEYDTVNYVLTTLVHLQRADTTYASTDLLNISSTRKFFYEMCCSIPDTPDSIIDEFFIEIDTVIQSGRTEADKIHELMKNASTDIHDLLSQIRKDENTIQVGLQVLRTLDQSILSIADVVQDFNGGEDAEKVFVYNFIKENMSKDPTTRGAEYDSIG